MSLGLCGLSNGLVSNSPKIHTITCGLEHVCLENRDAISLGRSRCGHSSVECQSSASSDSLISYVYESFAIVFRLVHRGVYCCSRWVTVVRVGWTTPPPTSRAPLPRGIPPASSDAPVHTSRSARARLLSALHVSGRVDDDLFELALYTRKLDGESPFLAAYDPTKCL